MSQALRHDRLSDRSALPVVAGAGRAAGGFAVSFPYALDARAPAQAHPRVLAAEELITIVPAEKRRAGLPRPLRRAAGPVLIVLIWHILSVTGLLPKEVLASPLTVLTSGAALWSSGELPAAMVASFGRVVVGLAIGGSVGVALAVLSGLFRLGEDLVDSTMQMLRTVPNVALIPLFIIWFGIGEAPKIALIALGDGLSPLPQRLCGNPQRGRVPRRGRHGRLGCRGPRLIRHVDPSRARCRMPSWACATRSASPGSPSYSASRSTPPPASVILMSNAREFFQTDVIVVCLAVYAMLGLGVDLRRPSAREAPFSPGVRPFQRSLKHELPDLDRPPSKSAACPVLRRTPRPARPRPRHPARGVRRPARRQRLRQEHAAAHSRRTSTARSSATSACPRRAQSPSRRRG